MKAIALVLAALSMSAGLASSAEPLQSRPKQTEQVVPMYTKCLSPKPFCGFQEYAMCICPDAYSYDCDWVCVSK